MPTAPRAGQCGEAQCQREGEIPSAPGHPTSDIMRPRVSSSEGGKGAEQVHTASDGPLQKPSPLCWHVCKHLQKDKETEDNSRNAVFCEPRGKTFTNDVLVEIFFFFGLSLLGHFIVPFLRT